MFGILSQIIITTLLPAFFIYSLYAQKYKTNLQRAFSCILLGLTLLVLFFVARWDSFIYPLRYVWLIVFVIAVVFTYRKPLENSGKPVKSWVTWSLGASVAVVFIALVFLFTSTLKPSGSVDIASPLRDGSYYVGHGGDSTFINYHNSHSKQRYALDIVGYQVVRNLLADTKDVASYPIYGANIYSPCSGTVVQAKNNAPNLTPPNTDKENPGGNDMIIECKGIKLDLAHMIQGSQTVKAGDSVTEGQIIGKVGNTGNTTEPHLHIHATRDDKPVPLTINGYFYVRNDILR